MSSITLKIASLFVRTLSKPIAVVLTPWQSLLYLTLGRTESRLKLARAMAFDGHVLASRNLYTESICD